MIENLRSAGWEVEPPREQQDDDEARRPPAHRPRRLRAPGERAAPERRGARDARRRPRRLPAPGHPRLQPAPHADGARGGRGHPRRRRPRRLGAPVLGRQGPAPGRREHRPLRRPWASTASRSSTPRTRPSRRASPTTRRARTTCSRPAAPTSTDPATSTSTASARSTSAAWSRSSARSRADRPFAGPSPPAATVPARVRPARGLRLDLDAGGDRPRPRPGTHGVPADLELRAPALRPRVRRLGGPGQRVHRRHPARDDGRGPALFPPGPVEHGARVRADARRRPAAVAHRRHRRQARLVHRPRHDPDLDRGLPGQERHRGRVPLRSS